MKKTIYASLFALSILLAACGNQQGKNGTSTDTTVMKNTDSMPGMSDTTKLDSTQHPVTPNR